MIPNIISKDMINSFPVIDINGKILLKYIPTSLSGVDCSSVGGKTPGNAANNLCVLDTQAKVPLSVIPDNLTGKSAEKLGSYTSNDFLLKTGGAINGNINVSGSITANSINSQGWVVTRGLTGWMNETYSGGFYMTQYGTISVYGNNSLSCNKTSQGSLSIGQARNIYINTENPKASDGVNGEIWLVI